MKDGIYHVRFSSQNDSGEGISVIKQGSINGGDSAYLYIGQMILNDKLISGHLTITRWKPSGISIFGSLDNFELKLEGLDSLEESFTVSGSIPGRPNLTIQITGRFLLAAA
jgi:T3SS negative regulator,GrlR